MPPARSTMTEMRADKLSGAAPRVHRKNSPIFRRHLPISRWELYCDARKNPGAEASMNMARITNASMKLARMPNVMRSQYGHRIEGDVPLSVRSRLPLPIPQGFPTAQGKRPRPRIGPPSQMRGHLLWRARAGSPRLKARAARPAPSYGSCIDCSGRSIPRRGALR
jgi:hypothetical protein